MADHTRIYNGYWIERYTEERQERQWYVVGPAPTGGWSMTFHTLKAAQEYIDHHPRTGARSTPHPGQFGCESSCANNEVAT
mgnify:CR=1 FL=1